MPSILDKIKSKFANSDKKSENSVYSAWQRRINAADVYYKDWERKFKCKELEKYYEGFQWDGVPDGYDPYVINLVHSAIGIKAPSLLFSTPVFHLAPKPGKADFSPTEAFRETQLKEDTLNSFAGDEILNLAGETELGILDSWFRFGLIEVGYGADWIDNPNAGKPILDSDYNEDCDPNEAEKLFEPEKLPEKEWIYVKRIPAHRFRVGGSDSPFLRRNNWVGYYEFVRTQDLLAAGVDEKKLDTSIYSARSADFTYDKEENSINASGDLTKIWKIWDLRAKEKIIVRDGHGQILFAPSKFSRLPLFDLRFSKRTRGFYPIPPVFNWKSPQDEVNESHEMNRAHRRKARSIFQVKTGDITPDELEKFLTAPDQSIIQTTRENAINPVQNANVDASLGIALQVSKDDFNIASATGAEELGVADRETATAAGIKQNKSQIRENHSREIVAKWLCNIGKEILLQAQEKFTLPFWINSNVDSTRSPDEVQEITETFKLIDSEDLGSGDFNVDISVDSMSPVANDDEKKKFLEVLSILQNFPVLAINPDLVYEVCYRCGYRNTKVIKQLVKVAQLQLMIQMSGLTNQAAMAQGGGPQNPMQAGNSQAAQNSVQNQTPPQLEQIRNQLASQLNG